MPDFNISALFEAMDDQRVARGLSWRRVADEMWAQSEVLNNLRTDHPISSSTLTGMAKRRAISCQHALFMLRWLDRTPESFITGGSVDAERTTLPAAGPDRRLRWRLAWIYTALDAGRLKQQMTWMQTAKVLRCTPSQLTGIRTARYAMGMQLAMRIVQWLERPAADFIYAAKW